MNLPKLFRIRYALKWLKRRGDVSHSIVACTECFGDEGFRRALLAEARKISVPCPACGAMHGAKLDRAGLERGCAIFFVEGTVPTGRGVFAPVIQVNDARGEIDLFGLSSLNRDIERLRTDHGIYCFYYGPPLWRFGKPSDEDGYVHWSDEDLDYVLDNCQSSEINPDSEFYRVQINVKEDEIEDARFCSPPANVTRSTWRFDSENVTICYCAFDIETCLHESRVSLENDIFVAILSPNRPLRLLNLDTCAPPADATRFEDPSIWLLALIYSAERSYPICRRLARRILERGYDGFTYTSFFQQAAERPHRNIAVFGEPIRDARVKVKSINTVRLNELAYRWQLGPVVLGAYR